MGRGPRLVYCWFETFPRIRDGEVFECGTGFGIPGEAGTRGSDAAFYDMKSRRCRAGFRGGEGDIDRLALVGLATIFTDPNAIEVFGFQTIPIGIVIVVWLSIPVVGWCVGIKTPCVEILLEHCAFFGIPFNSDAMSGKFCNM